MILTTGGNMFETIEVRRAANGIILVVTDAENDVKEFVYDSPRKALRVIKDHLEFKSEPDSK